MAPHSSTLAWKIPWAEEPGRLQSMGLQKVRHDWVISLSLFTFMNWRRQWQPTPVLLPGKSHGWRGLVGCSPWGCKNSDRTEWLNSNSNSHPYIFVSLSNHGNLNLDYRKLFYTMEHRILFENNRLKASSLGDFLGGSLAKAPCFQCRGSGFNL